MMNLPPTFHPALHNAWWLILPLVLPMAYIALARKDVARRLGDMAGYTLRERFWTITASLAPYPFMLATVWTPFTAWQPALFAGLFVYVTGATLYGATLRVMVTTPLDQPFTAGPYRRSRNPLYVAATIMMLGICLATTNLLLLVWLVVSCFPQHGMILAEERVCQENYGAAFERYLAEVPRYL